MPERSDSKAGWMIVHVLRTKELGERDSDFARKTEMMTMMMKLRNQTKNAECPKRKTASFSFS